MIYLIGGPPKCGKTTLSKRMFHKYGIPWISCDTLQCIVMAYTSAKDRRKKFPWSEIRKKTKRINDVLYDKYHWKKIIKLYRTPVKATYNAIDAFIESELKEGHDYILEGHALEPKLVQQLQNSYGKKNIKVIFLVKEDEEKFVQNIHKSETKNDWIIRQTKAPERIYPKIAKMICEYGKLTQKNAKKYGFKVIKTDIGFDTKLDQAMSYLIGKTSR